VTFVESDNEQIKAKAVFILRHAEGDSTVYEALQNIVLNRSLDSGESYIVNESLLALSEMDALSDRVKDSMINRLDESLSDSSGLFGTWAFAIGYARIDEAVPILTNGLLSDDPIYIKASANTLKQLGVSAKTSLPTLQDVFQKLKNDPKADFRVIEALEYALLSVSGEVPPIKPNQASGNQSHVNGETTGPSVPSQRQYQP